MPQDWTSADGSSGAPFGRRDLLRGDSSPVPASPWPVTATDLPAVPDLSVVTHNTKGAAGVSPRADDVTLRVDLARVNRVIRAAMGTLVVLDFLAAVLSAKGLVPYFFLRFFDADQKVNFPTGAKTAFLLFSTLLMLACWVTCKRSGDPLAKGWLLLAIGTGFAFIDETTYLHQSLSTAMANAFNLTGVLKYAWTILYAPAAAVIAIFLFRDLASIDPQVRRRLLPGGALFVGGALLLEPVKSNLSDSVGESGLAFRLTAAVSDSLELTGLAVLTGAMLLALSQLTARFGFSLEHVAAAAPPAASPDPYPAHQAPSPQSAVNAAAQYPPPQPSPGQQYGGQASGYGMPYPAAAPPQPLPPAQAPQPSPPPLPGGQPHSQQYGGEPYGVQYGTAGYPPSGLPADGTPDGGTGEASGQGADSLDGTQWTRPARRPTSGNGW